MKHCAKKLLGLAFALALCLAVGGTALAETPVLADVSDTLPEQEMLDYEPNVTTAAEGMNTATGDGYTVTIPTTVTVNSGENKETLMVTASVKQLRILKITLDSTNSWQLKHESGQVLAGYSLMPEDTMGSSIGKRGNWWYEEEQTTDGKKKSVLSLWVAQKAEGDFDINWKDSFTVPLIVEVTDPSQATMSGTYSDTVSFEFGLTKQCITYTVNVYKQKLELTADRKSVEAVDMVNKDGTVKYDAEPVHTEILEYPITYDPRTWSYSSDNPEDAYRWEELTMTRKPAEDVDNKVVDATNNATINLNLKRKWYYLDVNGATDYTDADVAGGNQGDHIGSFVEIMLSGDGVDWTPWFWQGDGDDYWAYLPYGVHFKLGLHHVKNGYVYDTGAGTLEGSGVRIIANKKEEHTATGETVNGSTYYVYTGEMTGEPTGTDKKGNLRYCYIPCYKKGLTYIANDGTGGTESVNPGNPPRTNVLYDENDTLKKPEDLKIIPPTGKSFAGWSTSKDYPTTGKLYQQDDPVSSVEWDNYTSAEMTTRPQGDDQKRVLYAIWRSATGPSRAPAKKALTLRYHANFDPNEELALDLDPNPLLEDMDDTFGFDPDPLPEDVDDALEEAVKTVTYRPGEDVVLRNCMFKRGGYVFVGWNTEPDGTGRLYRVNGVPMPITDWAAGDTVDLYAQWKKPDHLKPVVDLDPLPEEPDAAAPAAPPEDADAAFGVDPAAQPDALDDAFSV